MLCRRGCGRPKYNEFYICGTDFGDPRDSKTFPPSFFVVDPVAPVPKDLPKRGQLIFTIDETVHLLDVVGKSHYPTAYHFYAEFSRAGISRRISRTLLRKLVPLVRGGRFAVGRSKIFFAHERSRVLNWGNVKSLLVERLERWREISGETVREFNRRVRPANPEREGMCLRWNVAKKVPEPVEEHENFAKFCFFSFPALLSHPDGKREVGPFTFRVVDAPEMNLSGVKFGPGVFLWDVVKCVVYTVPDRDAPVPDEDERLIDDLREAAGKEEAVSVIVPSDEIVAAGGVL